jgi:hypothetical protein
MNIASFAAPGVFSPLQGLWRWLMPATYTDARSHPAKEAFATDYGLQKPYYPETTEHIRTPANSTFRPLRVVRFLEANQAPSNVGRMVISGRMRDVCAELDRLADCEAALP